MQGWHFWLLQCYSIYSILFWGLLLFILFCFFDFCNAILFILFCFGNAILFILFCFGAYYIFDCNCFGAYYSNSWKGLDGAFLTFAMLFYLFYFVGILELTTLTLDCKDSSWKGLDGGLDGDLLLTWIWCFWLSVFWGELQLLKGHNFVFQLALETGLHDEKVHKILYIHY